MRYLLLILTLVCIETFSQSEIKYTNDGEKHHIISSNGIYLDSDGKIVDSWDIINKTDASTIYDDAKGWWSASQTELTDLVFNSTADTIEYVSNDTIILSDTVNVFPGDYFRLTTGVSGTIYRAVSRTDSTYKLDKSCTASVSDEAFVNGNAPIYDRTSYGNNLTQTTGANQPKYNFNGGDLGFRTDGVNDRYSVSSITFGITEKNSISFWAKFSMTNLTSSPKSILGAAGHNVDEYLSVYRPLGVKFIFESNTNGDLSTSSNLTLSDNRNHYVITFDEGVLKYYQNGNLLSDDDPNITDDFTFNIIGSRSSGYYYDGYLNDIIIFSKILTTDEIETLYNNGAQ